MADDSTVDAVIFKGGYGIDYVEFAADIFAQVHEGSTANVSPSTQIAPELQPRFVGGNPPDLIDNSGRPADRLQHDPRPARGPDRRSSTPRTSRAPRSATRCTAACAAPGTFGDKFVALNYALTVYAVWYSSSLFEANGWTPPTTWDEAKELGAKAKEKGKYLFLWGKEAATLLPDDGHRVGDQGGRRRGAPRAREPRRKAAGRTRPSRRCSPRMKEIVDAGYIKPGGARHAVHRGAGAVEHRPGRRCCTRRARGSRTR